METISSSNILDRLSRHILADGYSLIMDIEKSHGSYLVGTDGKEYLDLFSMYASTAIGYNHPYLLQHTEFLGKMAINKPALSDMYNVYYADFIDTFSRIVMPEELQYAFFIEGGALAVENALKTAFDWKTRLNMMQGINKETGKVIHFKQSFHGRSGYTLSLTNTKDPRKHMYFPKFDWPRIDNPKLSFPITEESLQHTRETEKKAIEQIHTALRNYPDEIACIIIEPIQGEGGDNHFRDEFFRELRQICDEYEILLIFDEVQTGIGITGKMWCYQNFSVLPDIISFGKKTQVCGILANKEKLNQVPNNVFIEHSRINSTFGGNFIDMIRFKLIMEVIEKENLVENALTMGNYLKKSLLELDSTVISNIRGRGLFVAFDFLNEEKRNQFIQDTLSHQLIMLGCGESSIRFRPHLTITKEEIDKAIEIIKKCL